MFILKAGLVLTAINKLVRDAGEVTNSYVYIKSWIGTYGYMYRDIQMIRAIMYLAMVLVIGVACFNIVSTLVMAVKDKSGVSTLVMAVKDKSGDIAVLRTLGAKDGLIRAIFVWYGLLAGLFGSLCGVIIGVVVSLQLTPIIEWIEKLIGHQFLSSDIYFIDFLPSELHWLDVFYVLVTALLLSLLASWYPARRASNHLSDGGERQEWRYRSIKNVGCERWFNPRHLCLVWIAGRDVGQPVWCDYLRSCFTETYPDK